MLLGNPRISAQEFCILERRVLCSSALALEEGRNDSRGQKSQLKVWVLMSGEYTSKDTCLVIWDNSLNYQQMRIKRTLYQK
jgi:hypothetical protein